MARKASDMVMLLSSRGSMRGRNKSGFLQRLTATFGSVLGARAGGSRIGRSVRSTPRGAAVPAWIAVAVACLSFVGGFFAGGKFRGEPFQQGQTELQARTGEGGKAPGIIGEIDARPLSNEAFVVAAYPGVPAADAKARAQRLCEYLQAHDLQRARPYEFLTRAGPLWIAAVYFDGETVKAATRTRLLELPEDVPDEMFQRYRKTEENWPTAHTIQ